MITCMNLGMGEIVIIVIVAILVLGPEKTPYYAKKLGEALSSMKQYSGTIAQGIKENVAEPISEVVQPLADVAKEVSEPLKEITDPLKEIKAPLDEATKALNSAVKGTAAPLKQAIEEAAEAQTTGSEAAAEENTAGTEGTEAANPQEDGAAAVTEAAEPAAPSGDIEAAPKAVAAAKQVSDEAGDAASVGKTAEPVLAAAETAVTAETDSVKEDEQAQL